MTVREMKEFLSDKDDDRIMTIRVKKWLNPDEFYEDVESLYFDDDGRLTIDTDA